MKKLNNVEHRGQKLCVMWNPSDRETYKVGSGNIFIKNLASSTNPKTLYDVFSPFGKIHSCKVNEIVSKLKCYLIFIDLSDILQ